MKRCLITLFCLSVFATAAKPVLIQGGTYMPAVRLQQNIQPITVNSFYLDKDAVTEAEYLRFVQQQPRWQRSQTPAVFADSGYLSHWQNDTALADSGQAQQPVRRVSWFAARAYCQQQGGRLASLDEWEYAAVLWRQQQQLSDEDYAKLMFRWYSNPARTAPIVNNGPGVQALLGSLNEWVEDFQLLLSNGDDVDMLSGSCGDTARFMAEYDAAHYATFFRYQSRSNYLPQSTTSTLGFRCAYDVRSVK
jgi:formylglycine-generating enzyme required for sulfatase activity